MKKFNLSAVLIIAGFGFVFFVAIILVAALALSREGGFTGWGGDRIAVVYLEGVIFDSKTINEQLKMYADDSRVKAILVRMDTPGGGVAASQEIADQVKWLRSEKGKTVVISMGSVGASGGYYIACAADKIYANPGTITGSIGVIAEWVNYGNLLKWAQMQPEVIKSGEFKDVGSPTREITPKEREVSAELDQSDVRAIRRRGRRRAQRNRSHSRASQTTRRRSRVHRRRGASRETDRRPRQLRQSVEGDGRDGGNQRRTSGGNATEASTRIDPGFADIDGRRRDSLAQHTPTTRLDTAV